MQVKKYILAEIGVGLSSGDLRPDFLVWLAEYFKTLEKSPIGRIDYESYEVLLDNRFDEELKIRVQINGDSFASAKKDADTFVNQLASNISEDFFVKNRTRGGAEIFGQTLVAA